ncbi:MAG: lysoplasmalogenase [Kofleriaceae bacterium]
MIALTVACAVLCALLVVFEYRGSRPGRIAAKLAASLAFVAVGTQALEVGRHGDFDPGHVQYAHAIFTGLVLGAIGDACLLGTGKRWFLGGLVAFLLGHLAYVAGIAMIEPAALWPTDAGWLAALPIGAAALVLASLWPRLGSMRLPVIGYVVTITVMVVAAIAATRGQALPEPNRGRLIVGACVFFASDVAVARDRFVAHRFTNKLWGLPAYYAGQLLFAWSVAGL